MVLLGTYKLSSAYGLCRGAGKTLQFEAHNNLTLRTIFGDLCKDCQVRAMASIPPSAFSAGRIRETQRDRDMKVSNIPKGRGRSSDPTKYFNTSMMELSPQKYISKMMNSIWGSYNRYSPHNVKKIADSWVFDVELPKSGNTTKPEPVITLPASNFDKVWAAVNVPQSH